MADSRKDRNRLFHFRSEIQKEGIKDQCGYFGHECMEYGSNFVFFGKCRFCGKPPGTSTIQKMEDELDVIIFDRSKKPIMASETGSEIIEQAKVILCEHKKLSDIACQGGIEPRGSFNLAVIPTLAPYLIPLFVSSFSENFPKVQLKINEHQTDDIIRLLVEDEIDAGILVTPLNDDRLIERHLFFEPFYAYVSQGHHLSSSDFVSEAEMEINSLWILEEGHCFRNQVLKICSIEKSGTVLPNVEFASGNLETLKTLVRKSSGYTLLPELAVNELSSDEVATYIRAFRKTVPTREVSIVHSRSFLKEKSISALEQSILDNLPPIIRSRKRKDVEVVSIF